MTANANGETINVGGNIFRLVETIGRGSYGTVHKAVNLGSGAAVAVKVISKERLVRNPAERASIEKEIETMRVAVEQYENGHPNIVRLLATKESKASIFIVLEYCAGGDISSYIKQSSHGLSMAQTRNYMSQLAAGLQFLRQQHVIHRDLKPANLLLSSRNPNSQKVKIADFGFARSLANECLAESVVGSPLYMAPELLDYKSYDAKADLWSVGIILYEMVAKAHPFLVVDNCHATNHLALRRNIARYYEKYKHFILPLDVHVSDDCAALLEGLLRRDPTERISFEQFFNAPFLLPPPPTDDTDTPSTSGPLEVSGSPKQALVNQDWAAESDEYVMVDMEYEDVGREVLQDDSVPRPPTLTEDEESLEEALAQLPMDDVAPPTTTTLAPPPAVANTAWQANEECIEELLGICYKSFPLGGVALFVPTPLGDYIAFHEGCPHYYLSQESIEAAKHDDDDRKPNFVLGCLVYIEAFEATTERNPYQIRLGSTYHVCMVATLSMSVMTPRKEVTESPPTPMTESPFMLHMSPQRGHELSPPVTPKRQSTPGLTQHQRISFRTFQINHLALFFLKNGKLPYMAFNEGAPNYYLAEESIAAARGGETAYPSYVVGEIIFIDTFQATEDFNPYRLPYGARFYVVTVANQA
ncbi:ULK/ULK protein kinase [Saprolegnia diclina VS20]|uniref:ULK/ULK protein kinase n=1 Tax=Saprolegnia diclina (strain VS20) TaxID=1156394 RepID=T0RCS2_SAPDV|nr:ULK/ULK protein kinase [Saprolegnia diclina VS20]EQC30003.1 ULK/ULK protein kinase [Saprolegnia diclina VS20]|eukprot:XP_008616570.1 ULK/ULK protein kinase [Saprolegnia diclina VS20]